MLFLRVLFFYGHRGSVRGSRSSPSRSRQARQCPSAGRHVRAVVVYWRRAGAICSSRNHTVSVPTCCCHRIPIRQRAVWISLHDDDAVTALFSAIAWPMLRPCETRGTRLTMLCAHFSRYLQNGNILAARAFLAQLISRFASTRSDFVSPLHPTPLPVGQPSNGHQDEVVLTKDTLVNFAQFAVRTCQRAQGDKNRAVREAWVRLCGTYQSKGGPLAAKEVRKVSGCRPSQSRAMPGASA